MDEYVIKIHSLSYNLHKELKPYEPKLDKQNHCILITDLNLKDVKKIKRKCNKLKIQYEISNANFERGSSYRRTFFNSTKPIHEHYFCSYCGRYIPKKEITVDHLIPVAYAKYKTSHQKLLNFIGIKNINEAKNLAPACRSCNLRKGTKTGLWTFRGFVGKSQVFWVVRHICRFTILNIFVYYIYSNLLSFL